jgi:hypothetical protein
MTTPLTFSTIGSTVDKFATRERSRRPSARVVRWVLVLVVALCASAALILAVDAYAPQAMSVSTDARMMIGVFTGEFANGAPVYRLPSIEVSADRNVELARMEREERVARGRQVPIKASNPTLLSVDAGALRNRRK